MFPDEVLLEIFGFCVAADEDYIAKNEMEACTAWQSLVHVCHRWRSIVFESPCRLNLQLVCTAETAARDMLDVWPALPLVIQANIYNAEGRDNIIALLLEQRDRVKRIDLYVPKFLYKPILFALRRPFPELTDMRLRLNNLRLPLLIEPMPPPDLFFSGSAPHLQFFSLDCLPFPDLPKLLFSATQLVHLHLWNLLTFRDPSPEAMATSLSALINLESLCLTFPSFQFCSNYRYPPPVTPFVLPVLTSFEFKGASEYLDKLTARIDAPRLDYLKIYFFWQNAFDTPQFAQFISRTPTLKALGKAHVAFGDDTATVDFSSGTSGCGKLKMELTEVYVKSSQLSSLGQVCTSCLPTLSTLEDLYIIYEFPNLKEWDSKPHDRAIVEKWLGLLRPFAAVKNLYLSEQVVPCIVPTLKELVGSRTTEVLPALQEIFLEQYQPSGSAQEGVENFAAFAAARQATNHPITVTQVRKKGGYSDCD